MQDASFEFFNGLFIQKLASHGLSAKAVQFFDIAILCIGIIALAVTFKFLLHRLIMKIIKQWTASSQNKLGEIFIEQGCFNNLSHIAPAIILAFVVPLPLAPYAKAVALVKDASYIYITAILISVINSIIDAIHEIYNKTPTFDHRSISGYIQVTKTFVIIIGALFVLSLLIDKDLSSLMAGLTAFAAVLMFIFKDFITGIVAGIQISANDIIRVGDTIDMPSRQTEGTVIEITLNTVKVLNSNRTISAIPSHALVSESFQNWRGLDIREGRRIKRTIHIDMRSIYFTEQIYINKLKTNAHLKSIIEKIEPQIQIDSQMTNLGVFRLYLKEYLNSLPGMNTNTAILIHHLQSNENGLPVEVIAYSIYNDNLKHETLQNMIFEHIFAILPEFRLCVFQSPTGQDMMPGK